VGRQMAATGEWKTSLTCINVPTPPPKSEPNANKIDDWPPTSEGTAAAASSILSSGGGGAACRHQPL